MKKNLFLLFSFYFFVLQSVFVGLLRGETKFYRLALINCAFICFIAIFAKDSSQDIEESVQGKYGHETLMKKSTEQKINHFWMFLISFLCGILVIFCLKDMALYLRILIGIVGAMFVFFVGGLLFNYKSFRVWEGKFYLVMLILCLIWSMIKLLNIDFSIFNFGSGDDFDDLTGDVIEENLVITGDIENSVSDLTGLNEELDENTGEIIDDFGHEDLDTLATFADVIKYLLKDEILSTKTDLSFSYIGKSNPDYAYYKTAYEKKMIGKDLQPTKNLLCETYVVMKGLVEEWNVGKYSDIKQAYWNYAKNNGLLPDCQYGKYITLRDLYN